VWPIEWSIFNDLEWPLIQISTARHYSTFNIWEIIQDRTIVTVERQQRLACDLLISAISIDREWPLSYISKPQYFLTSNNLKMAQDSAIRPTTDWPEVCSSMTYQIVPFSVTLTAIIRRWLSHKRYDIDTWFYGPLTQSDMWSSLLNCAFASDLNQPSRSFQVLWTVSLSEYQTWYSIYNVRSQLHCSVSGRTSCASDYFSTVVFRCLQLPKTYRKLMRRQR